MAGERETVKQQLRKEISLPKKIGIDILGVLLIIGSGLFGWLPGPGGIPLLLAGLGLLSINHEWARRILLKIKDGGTKLSDAIFKDHPHLVLAYDVFAIILVVGAGVVFGIANGNIVRSLTIVLIFLGISLFVGNRNRITHINNFVKRVIRRNS